MTRFTSLALAAAAAVMLAAAPAAAFEFAAELPEGGGGGAWQPKSSGPITSPGDAFYANAGGYSLEDACDEAGGQLVRRFQGNDFVWVCVL